MKKIKELLLFIVMMFVPLVSLFIVSGFSADVLSDRLHFTGIALYIRMFLNDKTWVRALLNTIAKPVAVSFLLVLVFALIVFWVRKRVTVPRWAFYWGSVFIGGVCSFIYFTYLGGAAFLRLFTPQTTVLDAISLVGVLFSLYIGILTAFVFWILELLTDLVKRFKRRR